MTTDREGNPMPLRRALLSPFVGATKKGRILEGDLAVGAEARKLPAGHVHGLASVILLGRQCLQTGGDLLGDDRLQPFAGRLNCTLVDVAANPPPPQLLRHG